MLVLVAIAAASRTLLNTPILHFPPHERSGTYIDLQIGSPPQTVSLIFDTGSSTLAVGSPSTAGTGQICPADEPLPMFEESNWNTENLNRVSNACVVGAYDPTQSSTANVNSEESSCSTALDNGECGFAVAYGTGAYGIDGYLVYDDLTIDGTSATVSIGAITDMVGGWQQPPANGIFGVARSSLNCLQATLGGPPTPQTCRQNALVAFLSASGLPNSFALCLGNYVEPGVLTLGGPNPDFYTGDMYYTPILHGGFYVVEFTAIGVNGQLACDDCVAEQGYPTIVDSGTPPLLLGTTAFETLVSTAAAVSCTSDSDCLVTMQIGNVCVNAAGLLSCVSGSCAVIHGAVSSNAASVNGGSAIIGNAAINQLYIEFNNGQHQIGFANRQGQCSAPCSSFLSVHSCDRAQCTWSGDSCTGDFSLGNSAIGSTVSSVAAGGSCFTTQASDDQEGTTTQTSDDAAADMTHVVAGSTTLTMLTTTSVSQAQGDEAGGATNGGVTNGVVTETSAWVTSTDVTNTWVAVTTTQSPVTIGAQVTQTSAWVTSTAVTQTQTQTTDDANANANANAMIVNGVTVAATTGDDTDDDANADDSTNTDDADDDDDDSSNTAPPGLNTTSSLGQTAAAPSSLSSTSSKTVIAVFASLAGVGCVAILIMFIYTEKWRRSGVTQSSLSTQLLVDDNEEPLI